VRETKDAIAVRGIPSRVTDELGPTAHLAVGQEEEIVVEHEGARPFLDEPVLGSVEPRPSITPFERRLGDGLCALREGARVVPEDVRQKAHGFGVAPFG
jgi:hypothetical protein